MPQILPFPPENMPYVDPATGMITEPWRRYQLSLDGAVATGSAPSDAQFWVSTANGELSNERNLGVLSSGFLKITQALGIAVPSTVASITAADMAAGGTFPAINGSALTNLNASALTSGSVPDARLSSNVPLKNGANTFTSSNIFPAGAGTGTVIPSGRVASITAAAPTTGTIEQILATYTMPANTLGTNGYALRIEGGYSTAATANNKTIRVRVGGIAGTVILAYTSATNNGNVWFSALLTRRTATTTYGNGYATDGATMAVTGAAPTPTLTNNVDIVITGETPTASGDLSLQQAVFGFTG